MYTHIHIYIYIHIHTYVHTYLQAPRRSKSKSAHSVPLTGMGWPWKSLDRVSPEQLRVNWPPQLWAKIKVGVLSQSKKARRRSWRRRRRKAGGSCIHGKWRFHPPSPLKPCLNTHENTYAHIRTHTHTYTHIHTRTHPHSNRLRWTRG